MNNWVQRIALLSLFALLGWAVWESRWSPSPQAMPPAAGQTTMPPRPPAPASPAPLSEYQATLERPLFYPDRRLPAGDSGASDSDLAPSPAPGNGSRLTLTAIVEENGEHTALLGAPGLATSARARTGDTVAGWRVEQITDDSVTVSLDGRQETLPLRHFDVVTTPPHRRPLAPPIAPPALPRATPPAE